jgi:hypothetical protein
LEHAKGLKKLAEAIEGFVEKYLEEEADEAAKAERGRHESQSLATEVAKQIERSTLEEPPSVYDEQAQSEVSLSFPKDLIEQLSALAVNIFGYVPRTHGLLLSGKVMLPEKKVFRYPSSLKGINQIFDVQEFERALETDLERMFSRKKLRIAAFKTFDNSDGAALVRKTVADSIRRLHPEVRLINLENIKGMRKATQQKLLFEYFVFSYLEGLEPLKRSKSEKHRQFYSLRFQSIPIFFSHIEMAIKNLRWVYRQREKEMFPDNNRWMETEIPTIRRIRAVLDKRDSFSTNYAQIHRRWSGLVRDFGIRLELDSNLPRITKK